MKKIAVVTNVHHICGRVQILVIVLMRKSYVMENQIVQMVRMKEHAVRKSKNFL